MRKLTEVSWFKNEYVKAYDIINIENRMPPLDKIYVLDDYDVKTLRIKPRDTVMAFALLSNDNGNQYVWFRYEPPDLSVFVHEMIHLAKKYKQLDEEIYAYNLTPLVTILVERNIVPKHNVLRLLEDLNLNVLSRKITQYFHTNSIEELFSTLGVVPYFTTFENGTITIRKEYTENDVMIGTMMELIAAAEYNDYILNFILDIVNELI
jgi:hypothetical protein